MVPSCAGGSVEVGSFGESVRGVVQLSSAISSMFGFKREPVRGSHGWQGWVFDSHRSAPPFARMRLESRLAGGSGSPSHLPAPGGKSETVYPKSLAALRGEGYVWSRRARGEGSGGEVKNALISQKALAAAL